jgi:hypothetical protein
MAQKFSIHLSILESRMLHHICKDPDGWIRNLIEWRVRIVEDDLIPKIKQQLIDAGAKSIPANREGIIAAGNLQPKDPNWSPAVPRDHLTDDNCDIYTIELADDEITVLEWMYENPHEHIHDWIVERCQIGIKEKAEVVTKELLADPTWTDPIPLDPEELLDLIQMRTVHDHMEISGAHTAAMVENMRTDPDFVPITVPFHRYLHHDTPEFPTPSIGPDSDAGPNTTPHPEAR